MAVAVTTIKNRDGLPEVFGGSGRWVVAAYTFSSSYATGGESITPAALGFPSESTLVFVNAHPVGGYTFAYDYTNKKLLAYRSAAHTHDLFLNNADVADSAGARVNAGTNLLGANTGADITVTGVADATGHGGVLQVAAAAAAQVSATVDLSAVTTRIFAIAATVAA